jgi:hypothetical protein
VNLSVGKIVKKRIHCLSTIELHKHVREHEEIKKKQKQKVDDRKKDAKGKFDKRLKEAIGRFRNSSQRLRMEDIKTLSKEYFVQGDSPVRKSLNEAKKKFDGRIRSRVQHKLQLLDVAVMHDIDDDLAVNENIFVNRNIFVNSDNRRRNLWRR